ncbi:MAG: hypothetical protein M3Y91_06645 [Actinomycetota bacterium]|nr:hypothetical protein [Actinomycetota bacterium]
MTDDADDYGDQPDYDPDIAAEHHPVVRLRQTLADATARLAAEREAIRKGQP